MTCRTVPSPETGPLLRFSSKLPRTVGDQSFKFFMSKTAIRPKTPARQPINSHPMTFRPFEWAIMGVSAAKNIQANNPILRALSNCHFECLHRNEAEHASQEGRNITGGGAVCALTRSVLSVGGHANQMPSI